MKALAGVIGHLERRGVLCALVGGVALGAHGIARAMLDIDLMVVDPVVLDLVDAQLLLAANPTDRVEARLAEVPTSVRAAWKELRSKPVA